MNFHEDLGEFFFDFGEMVQLRFADGTTRNVTAIWDAPSIESENGSVRVDLHNPQITVRTSDVEALKYKDTVLRAGVLFDVTKSPMDDGTGLSCVELSLAEPE